MEAEEINSRVPDAQRSGHAQFSLRGLFWITTLVAGVCAAVGWAVRERGDAPGTVLLVMVFSFWPSIATIIAWSWPGIGLTKRFLVVSVVGGGILAFLWGYAWVEDELHLAYMATILAFFLAWFPQALFIGLIVAVVTCLKGRRANECD